ncbi:sensor histidine kinase [Streptomyces sp. NPDC057445]|uniref:sensor histidine kinase n=1 Tax=Streptomyces sp. NPDC057445 TaxID=3346136 RepID=UPI0036BE453F
MRLRERRKRTRTPADGPERLPLRKSLLGRLLAVSALVAACSVAATAWLVVRTTTVAIEQEQGQNLSDDARIYQALLGYAATHPRWDGVEKTVRDQARRSGRRITVTTQQRQVIADSATGPSPGDLPNVASAVVDPLSASPSGGTAVFTASNGTGPTTGSSAASIDPRAVGPFRLPGKERARLRSAAEEVMKCLSSWGLAADIAESPSGRPRIQPVGSGNGSGSYNTEETTRCGSGDLDQPTDTEIRALTTLNELVNACLDRQSVPAVKLGLDLSWKSGPAPAPQEAKRGVKVPAEQADRTIADCVNAARREQLAPHVAPPALLFIGGPPVTSVPGFDVSPAGTARIAGVAALVLALTVGASVLAGTRLVRPLHALTDAARRMRDDTDRAPVPVPVRADNEIGALAAAFNDMAAHRARLEEQRKVMVSDVAHELRSPLSTIRSWLEAAQDGLAEPDPAFVSSLLEEAVQLQHIVDDLQDLAQADAGALRLRPEPVRIEDVLDQAAAAHRGVAETSGVSLTVTTSGPPAPLLTADPVRLRQAVGNLVSNAVRHTPSGGSVTLRAYGSGGATVVVDVADTGTGIATGDLPYVFDRFWRAEKSRSRRTGGSGLGLAIVRKLAEAHGGTAEVESTEGKGSVFTLRIPAAGPAPGAAQIRRDDHNDPV